MTRVLITGSSEGLGLRAGQILVRAGHDVTLHARNDRRAADAAASLPEAAHVLIGDVSSIAGMTSVATQANEAGRYDAVIHNVGVGHREQARHATADGLSHLFAINVLAPYVLTALMAPPGRLIYLSSGLHRGGSSCLADLQWEKRQWDAFQAYSDSKLFDVMLAFGVARHWPSVRSNVVEPGWVPTKMGGPGAPDDLEEGSITQAWLAVSDDDAANVSGEYFYHQRLREPSASARDSEAQDLLIATCATLSGVELA